MRSRSLMLGLLLASACGECDGPEERGVPREPTPAPAACPASGPAPTPLPDVSPEHRTAAYWIERAAEQGDPDEPLLTVEEIAEHDRALRGTVDGWPLGAAELLAPIDERLLTALIVGRLAPMRENLADGTWVGADGEPVPIRTLRLFDRRGPPPLSPQWRIAQSRIAIRCGPTLDGFYRPPPDPRFDRNLCSTAQVDELLQLLAPMPDGMVMVRTGYTFGWVAPDAELSPPLSHDEARERLTAAPTDPRPLTRRAFLDAAFVFLDDPYGWGGYEGGRDCSRLVMDLFGSFGLRLPRNSGQQARAGTHTIEVRPDLGDEARRRLIEEAAREALVLLQLPGHIMIHLGATEDGEPMVLHATAEYLEPCPGGEGETVRTIDRVAVSTLELGVGSSKGSLLSRVTTVVVLGRPPP